MQAPQASKYREPLEGEGDIWGVVCSTLSTTLEAHAIGNDFLKTGFFNLCLAEML